MFKIGSYVLVKYMMVKHNQWMEGRVFQVEGFMSNNEIVFIKSLDDRVIPEPGVFPKDRFRLATPAEINNAMFHKKMEDIINE